MVKGIRKEPLLLNDEEIVIKSSGFYKSNLRSGWKPGHVYLTNRRLIFWQQSKYLFQIFLDSIKGIAVQQIVVVLKKADTLCLSYKSLTGQGNSRVWVFTKDLEKLKSKIFEQSMLNADQVAIEKIASELDSESRSILHYLWENSHATIEELASLYDAPNHMEVLQRIRNVINPVSERIVGYPILVFERSKIDELTGKKILYSWWIIGADKKDERKATFLDLFDEGDYLRIIMELFGVSEETIKLTVNRDKLIVCAFSPERKYLEEIPLPVPVNSNGLIKKYKNGILEVRLSKMPVIVNHGNTRNITEDYFK
ncbi:hypothetical protein KJ656_11875 [bacterium]|nr:hypothetical protein [bacterium]